MDDLGLINKEVKGLIFKINDYRVAQAHIKKGDKLREPTKENWDLFSKISIEVHSKLSSQLMLTDIDLREKVKKIVTIG